MDLKITLSAETEAKLVKYSQAELEAMALDFLKRVGYEKDIKNEARQLELASNLTIETTKEQAQIDLDNYIKNLP